MTSTYAGTVAGSGTYLGTGALSGVTEQVSQSDAITADLAINSDGSFTGTEDQVVTTIVTLDFPGQAPSTSSSTSDSGPQAVSGNVNTPNTTSSSANGNTVTTTWTFSSDQSSIDVTGTDTYNSTGISGSYNFSGTLNKTGAGLPDLTFTAFGLNASSLPADGDIDINYTIANSGSGNAPASEIGLYYSTSPTFSKSSATLLFDFDTGALAAHSSSGEAITFNLNNLLAPGQYYFFLYADDPNQVAESNENNNATSGAALTITGSPADLTASLTQATVQSSNPTVLDFKFQISNIGTGNAAATSDAIYLSPTATFDSSTAILLGTVGEAALAAGDVGPAHDSTFALPDTVTTGQYYAFVVANDGDTVTESDYANDVSNAIPISVSGAPQQIAVSVGPGEPPFTVDSPAVTLTGTESIIYTFQVSSPFAFYSTLTSNDGGQEFSGELTAVGGFGANPTLGRGPGTPDPGGLNDATTDSGTLADPLMPGDYTYTVTRTSAVDDSSSFTLTFATGPVTEGNNLAWADNLGAVTSISQSGIVTQIDNKDVYKFTLTAAAQLDFTVTDPNNSQIDPYFSVQDENGSTMVGEYGAYPEVFDAGVYYISVYHVDNVNFWLNDAYTQDTSDPGPEHYLISMTSTPAIVSGQTDNVSAGQTDSGTVISGGDQEDRGTANNNVIYGGGVQNVDSGGVANNTSISGGTQNVQSGGKTAGVSVTSGGVQNIKSGGTGSYTTVGSSGAQVVSGGGSATTTTVSSGGSQVVSSGGSAPGTTIGSGGSQIISSGGSATNTTIGSGGSQIVGTGGGVSGTTVASGGVEIVSAGGKTSGSIVTSGGVEIVYGGGIASGTVVSSGGVLELYSGGSDPGATFQSGATFAIVSGYVDNGAVVSSGMIFEVGHGGTASGTVVQLGGTLKLASGAVTPGTTYNNGATLEIASGYVLSGSTANNNSTVALEVGLGGTANSTLVSAGVEYVFAGGTDIQATLSGFKPSGLGRIAIGGEQHVTGIASNVVVDAYGDQIISSGGTASATTVNSGGEVGIDSGGTLIGLTVNSGGSAYLNGGTLELVGAETLSGITIGTGTLAVGAGDSLTGYVLSGGSVLAAGSGGVLRNTMVSSGGTLQVQAGGTADPTVVSSGGIEVISAGGTDLGAVVSSGGTQLDYGWASGVSVGNGGLQFIAVGGTGAGSLVSSGGEQYIGSGGTAIGAQVKAAGAEVVFGSDSGASLSGTSAATATQYDFGIALGGTTYSNGFQEVALVGAVASGMTVEFGGEQYVGSGGTTSAAQIAKGGAEVVFGFDAGAGLSGTQYDYGTASGGTTYNSGFQVVAPGATAISMTVEGGGEQYIGSGGTAIATNVAAQGAQVVFGSARGTLVSGTQYDFDYASGGTTFNNGYQLVAPGATAIGMTVDSGGQQYIGGSGTALATNIAGQGAEVIFGSDSGARINGTQYLFGVARGGTTFGGGSQQVEFGGTAIGMTVSSLGVQNVGAGGTASSTAIMSQGAEVVHGTDLNATISGTQYVLGLASGTVVGTGGYQLVSAGGTISGASISGGAIELKSGSSDGAAPISFTGAGELVLDASSLFSGTIAGFGSASLADSIDLADIAYVAPGSAGATTVGWTPSANHASGTLSVAEGGHAANITLFGQYVVGNFSLAPDGHGGTLVTDPPVTAAVDPNPVTVLRHA